MFNCKTTIAGLEWTFELYSEKTAERFRPYLSKKAPVDVCCDAVIEDCKKIRINSRDIDILMHTAAELERDPYLEFIYVMLPFCDQLLRYNRCILHGTAFIWGGKAYIFSGPSGVGKSTQFHNWKKQYGDEVEILNGDKPILEWVPSLDWETQNDKESVSRGTIQVHPSPWNGKEGWRGFKSAELGGIILLEQGSNNQITRCSASEVVLPILREMFYSGSSKELNHLAAEMERRILDVTPVWHFVNDGTPASSEMAHDELQRELDRAERKREEK